MSGQNMLVEAYSQQLVANLNPMNQAIGSLVSQSVKTGEVNLIKSKAVAGDEIFTFTEKYKDNATMSGFYDKLLNQLVNA